ncbi:MAG: amidohydrolase, partial [Candidatus Bathyarchaeia archaeon]
MSVVSLELLIEGGTVLTMGPKGIIRQGAVVVEDGLIVDVDRASELKAKHPRYERLDAKGKLVLPGLVNTHQHAAMSLLRGYADDLPLQEWLEKRIWPLEAHMRPEDIYRGALLTAAESLLGGCTTVNTMYHYRPGLNEAKAFADAGARAAVGHVCFSWRKDEDRRMLRDLAEEWHGALNGLIRATVDPHAPYTVDPAYMQELHQVRLDLNERFGSAQQPILTHMHLAETMDEAQKTRRAHQLQAEASIVQYLDELGVLDSNILAAHCVHLTGEDVWTLAARGVSVAHCPVSNLKLASGVAPIPRLLEAGVKVGIGTDSSCSNNSSDMFEAVKVTALLHKGVSLNPTVMNAETVLRMVTIEGAKALRWDNCIGSLE